MDDRIKTAIWHTRQKPRPSDLHVLAIAASTLADDVERLDKQFALCQKQYAALVSSDQKTVEEVVRLRKLLDAATSGRRFP